MGVGNFFGMLPAGMQHSRLYGVELDSLSGRIAKQLYPNAHITISGFEQTSEKDFYDLAIGNVPFGQYRVNDPAFNKLGFSMSAIIIGIILGGMAEQNFVGSLIMSDGNFNIFYTRPLCLFFLIAAVLSLLSPVLGKLFKKA